MRTTQIRQQLHDYIDSAEDKKLKAIYTLLEIENENQLSVEQQVELDRRYADYKNGIGKTFTWDETVAFMDKALNKQKAGK